MHKKIMGLSLAAVLRTGCSSIISKNEYAVAINSTSEISAFRITNRAGQNVHSGVTPSTVTLKSSSGYFKGETYNIEVQKEGYSSKSYTIASNVDGWYFGNLLFGGILGVLIVDPMTSAMYNLPGRVHISLDQPLASAGSDATLSIATYCCRRGSTKLPCCADCSSWPAAIQVRCSRIQRYWASYRMPAIAPRWHITWNCWRVRAWFVACLSIPVMQRAAALPAPNYKC